MDGDAMELAITGKNENEALQRTELSCTVSYEKAVPGRKELREAICAATGADPSLLVIVSVLGSFGTQKAVVQARIYRSKEALSVESRHLLVRDGLAEKKKKEGKKAAAPAKK